MYRRKNDLADLLNTLSTGEVRHFSQYLKSLNHKETPFYLKLFEAAKQQKSVLPHSERSSVQVYTNAKKRLYRHLMQCLRHYHQEKSVEIIIQNMLCEIEVLYDRGLPLQSLVLMEKAHQLALTHQHYSLMLQILSWERKLNIVLNKPKRTSNEIAQEEKQILENFNQIIELENIYSKVKEIKKRHGYVKGDAKQQLEQITVKNPYLTTQYKDVSQRGKHYYHIIHALYYRMIFDHKQAYEQSKKLLIPEMEQIAPNQYIEGILEHISSCMHLGYFKEMMVWLDFADHFIKQKQFEHSTSFLLTVFYFRTCYRLIAYNYTGVLKDIQNTIKETEEKLILYDSQLSTERKMVIYGNLRNSYIAIGNLDKADKILEKILQKETRFVRSDVYNDMFLSRLFSFLASKTYVLLPAMALSAYRHYSQIKSQGMQLEVELKISSILMKDYDYGDENIKKGVLLEIKNVLLQYIALFKGLNNFQEIYSFYIIWADSMFYDRPFYKQAQIWHKQHIPHWQ